MAFASRRLASSLRSVDEADVMSSSVLEMASLVPWMFCCRVRVASSAGRTESLEGRKGVVDLRRV
jgi:hypothetical protein